MQVSFSFLVPPCVGDPCDDSLGAIYIWACSGFSYSRCPASDAAFCCWFVILCKPHNPKVVLAARSAAEKLVPEKLLKYLQTGLNRNLECWGRWVNGEWGHLSGTASSPPTGGWLLGLWLIRTFWKIQTVWPQVAFLCVPPGNNPFCRYLSQWLF